MRLLPLLTLIALGVSGGPSTASAASDRGPILRVETVHVCHADGRLTRPPVLGPACRTRAVDAVDPQGRALWLLAEVTVPASLHDARTPMAVLMQGMGSTAIYWDDVRISTSGVVATTAAEEQPGRFVHIAPLRTDELRPGVHRLAVLISNHRGPVRVQMPVHVLAVAPFELVRDGVGRGSTLVLMALGALLLAAVYFVAVIWSGVSRGARRQETAWLIVMIACALVQGGAELWRTMLPITYVGQIWRLLVIVGAATGVGAALVAYAARRFASAWTPRVLWAFAAGAACAWTLPGFDRRTLVVLALGGALAIAVTAPAARRGEPGARAVAAVLLLFTAAGIAEIGTFLDRDLFVGLTILTLVLLMDHVRQLRALRDVADAAEQQVRRLELELLRRRLTPHWLLNMLNALAAWIEEEPATAVRMVGLLGDEFHRLAHPIDAPLIAARDELAACDRLLALMSLRSGRAFTLDATGVAPELPVPPGVLHTLVENALTHGGYRRGVVFTVRQHEERGRTILAFAAPHGELAASVTHPAATDRSSAQDEGFGLRYVRARLRAAFGDEASIVSGPAPDGGWQTVLQLGGAEP